MGGANNAYTRGALFLLLGRCHDHVTPSYDTPKSFCPIVLLNTLGKLIEKAIGNRIQHHTIMNGYLHPNQLGGIHPRSTADTGLYLTHLV